MRGEPADIMCFEIWR